MYGIMVYMNVFLLSIPQGIHGTGSKYTSPMDPMGMNEFLEDR